MAELVKLTRHDDIAVIVIDNPPVNALGPGVPEGIEALLNEANHDPLVKAIVILGAGRTFIGGADIRELARIASGDSPRLNWLPFLEGIEDSAKPVVMAIEGVALGGGLETAMAGHYRVITPTAQVGQPEVKLGLIPGAGGTQRLPRLAGIPKALEMCLKGEPIQASEALALGIADQLIEGDLLTGALAFAREVADKPLLKTRDRTQKLHPSDSTLFVAAREQVRKGRGALQAPLAVIEAVEASTQLDFFTGCQREAELFNECLFSSQAQALIHAFFGERTVSKIPGLPKDVQTYPIRKAAVIGAGTMGGGIAMTLANAGIPVLVKESTQAALDRGMNAIRGNYSATVTKGRVTPAEVDQRLALITPQLTYNGFEYADIIVEAVFENMAVKKQVFAELDDIAQPLCLLASNTSSLDIDEIASATKRPGMVIGMHFFSPANVMKLLEVVRGQATSAEAIATAMALGKKLKKVAVLAGNSHGFIGNRMIMPYLREAQFMVEEGASVEQVNQALFDFGMAMGPLAMDDLAGLDVDWAIRQEFARFQKPGLRAPLLADQLYEMGRYGQKTGRGWSLYDVNRRPSPDLEISTLIEEAAQRAGVRRHEILPEEIVDRCIYALVNEGAKLLEEGVALRAVDIDITYLYGYGFPNWRGGPMFHADTIGLANVLRRLEQFEVKYGSDFWAPAPLLKHLAATDQTFRSWDKQAVSARA